MTPQEWGWEDGGKADQTYVRSEFLWRVTAAGSVQHCEEALLEVSLKSGQMSTSDTAMAISDSQEMKIGTFIRAVRLLSREGASGIKRVIKTRVLKRNP